MWLALQVERPDKSRPVLATDTKSYDEDQSNPCVPRASNRGISCARKQQLQQLYRNVMTCTASARRRPGWAHLHCRCDELVVTVAERVVSSGAPLDMRSKRWLVLQVDEEHSCAAREVLP